MASVYLSRSPLNLLIRLPLILITLLVLVGSENLGVLVAGSEHLVLLMMKMKRHLKRNNIIKGLK